MLGIGLTESVPFTASPPPPLLRLSLREGSHSLRFPLYSRLGFSPAESLVGPKVMLLSNKQWLSLAGSKNLPVANLPHGIICIQQKNPQTNTQTHEF